MLPYAAEHFTAEEEDVLRRYVTNLDRPVFALVNLPEVVKGALFARYSRSSKSLRRLFLDEFVSELDVTGDAGVDATMGLRRAEELYDRVFLEYGDDSVAQLGGVHLACEQASNLLTKVLERGRLMSYLEQSTRYIGYDARLPTGHYRYYRDPHLLESPVGARYVGAMDRMFDSYAQVLADVQVWLAARHAPAADDTDLAFRRAVRAKALDVVRGLLPAASLSNVGIYGTGQSYEHLVLRLRSHPLPEARQYAELVLEELRKVIPSFVQRLDRPERGGRWTSYLEETRRRTDEVVARLFPGLLPDADEHAPGPAGAPSVTLVDFDPDGEEKVLVAICAAHLDQPEAEVASVVQRLSSDERRAVFEAYVGERTNRRHRPGRAFERTAYRFEVVTDYGAFRDLQRHRMLTVEWLPLGVHLGYEVPAEIVDSGLEGDYVASMERSRQLFEELRPVFPLEASYAVALAYRVRYTLQLNAREAMHLIELRSGPQGHAGYRWVAQEMHRQIAERAGHHLLAEAMAFVDHGGHELGRIDAERDAEHRRQARGPVAPG